MIYKIGDWITIGYLTREIKDFRELENGDHEYLLSDDKWVSETYIKFMCD